VLITECQPADRDPQNICFKIRRRTAYFHFLHGVVRACGFCLLLQTMLWTSRASWRKKDACNGCRADSETDGGLEHRGSTSMRVASKCDASSWKSSTVDCQSAGACSGDSSCGSVGGPSHLHRKLAHCTNLSSCKNSVDQRCHARR